jgi:deazaflavin-dependent oxidoreductase (nitroreductase family)
MIIISVDIAGAYPVCAAIHVGGRSPDRTTHASQVTLVRSPAVQSGYRGQAEKSRYDKLAQAFARTRLGGWLFIRVFPAIDRRLIPLTKGRLMVAVGQPILLLHTRGAKSGQPRTTPLLYTPHDGGYVIVASKAGATHHPAWYHNLRAHPDEVKVDVRGKRIAVRAREADAAERQRLWRLVNDNYDGYEVYQHRAVGRTIPVIVLEPVS